MEQHESAQAATSSVARKALWLATLNELEQEYLAFQKRGDAVAGTAQADVASTISAP